MAIFNVTNLSDSGLGSLRHAIQDANNTLGTDTINFANSLKGGMINLSTGQLTITDSLTINGLGANLLKINGGNKGFRVFNIDDGTANLIDVSINGLTITGGNPSRDGGGIYSTLANLTVSNSIISGNRVNGSAIDDFDGGGIYSKFGSLTVLNSTISGNTIFGDAPDGGGIYSIDEDLKVINSIISGNTVEGLRFDSGGGIYSARGNVTVSGSTISNNSASTNSASTDPSYNSADGGGIFSRDGNMTVTNSTISGNSASGPKTDGGGLYSKDGNLTVTNSTISGNSTTIRGGGIFSIRGKLTVTNSTISANSASTGGGIFNSATFNVTNTIIANSLRGGDCYNSGSVVTNSNNLIEDGSGKPALRGDPNLGSLQNNGGPTFTHALLPGSIAINAGSNTYAAGLPYDQRGSGFSRIAGGTVDIGAYEVQSLPTVSLTVNPSSVQEDGNTNLIYTFTRTGSTSNALTLNFKVAGTATYNTDYTQIGATNFSNTIKTITIAAGATKKTLTIDPKKDTINESNETVSLTLAAGTEYIISTKNTVVGTIINDDANSSSTTLRESYGDDYLNGLAGNDTLVGSIENDSLTGGIGLDRFKSNFPNEWLERITDFNVADGYDRSLCGNFWWRING